MLHNVKLLKELLHQFLTQAYWLYSQGRGKRFATNLQLYPQDFEKIIEFSFSSLLVCTGMLVNLGPAGL